MNPEEARRVMERITAMSPEPDEEELLREFHETTRGFPARNPRPVLWHGLSPI